VLHQNAKHIEVGRQDGAKFMLDQYGLVVSNRTIGNIFAKADLTRRRMRLRTSGYMKTEDELVEMYVDYVKELHLIGALKHTHASLDFTTTRHKAYIRFGYGASGSGAVAKRRRTPTTCSPASCTTDRSCRASCTRTTWHSASTGRSLANRPSCALRR
jgi:hypothetical protein